MCQKNISDTETLIARGCAGSPLRLVIGIIRFKPIGSCVTPTAQDCQHFFNPTDIQPLMG
ncbi:MAG: hypothetical protein ACK4GN_19095 [Runella sp.]